MVVIVKGKNVWVDYNLENESEYLEYLYWEKHRTGEISENEVMIKFKEKFGEYPDFEYILTFKADWHEWWYENIHKYIDDEEGE